MPLMGCTPFTEQLSCVLPGSCVPLYSLQNTVANSFKGSKPTGTGDLAEHVKSLHLFGTAYLV